MVAVIAIGTKAMEWSAVSFRWLQRVGEGSRWKLLQLVALVLCRPAFQLHNFFFKLVYAFERRRQAALGIDYVALNIDDRGILRGLRFQSADALSDLERRFRA